ncbi:MAG: hypothetical protein GC183_12140 [Thiobacillus sp.]|nr:hypothetical protein [Thiobacillus sp.]
MKSFFLAWLLCAFVPGIVQASVSVPEHLIDPEQPRMEDPDTIVRRYLVAVDRGELEIFGQKLDRSMLTPVRVEYVYDLSSRTVRIRIHSNLKQPLPVPGQHDCQILSVGAEMEGGHITEIESHVWLKQ